MTVFQEIELLMLLEGFILAIVGLSINRNLANLLKEVKGKK